MEFGLTEVTVGVAAVTTVAVAVAVTEVSATDVAVTITVLGEGTVAGAVYTPVVDPMLPLGFGLWCWWTATRLRSGT